MEQLNLKERICNFILALNFGVFILLASLAFWQTNILNDVWDAGGFHNWIQHINFGWV